MTEQVKSQRRARVIAYYLPQFHPIPENDEWWGPGFTEWTNVARAKPLYRGHVQPKIPADLGFYDLRVPETREAQARLASSAGIEGFCYWHYWFGNGRRILERPFQEVLDSGRPDFPFCLAWANQSWSGIWHGNPTRVLVTQEYPGQHDEAEHFRTLLPAFLDRRYIKVDGKPLFAVYDPHALPNAAAFIGHWQQLALAAGLPGLFMVALTNALDRPGLESFDAISHHGPGEFVDLKTKSKLARFLLRLKNRHFGERLNKVLPIRTNLPTRYPYAAVVAHALSKFPDTDRHLPCILPNWDNTPRSRSRGIVFEGATPELFGKYVEKVLARVYARPAERRIVFLKAWNEWAEGNFLEPDQEYGMARLDVLREKMLPQDP